MYKSDARGIAPITNLIEFDLVNSGDFRSLKPEMHHVDSFILDRSSSFFFDRVLTSECFGGCAQLAVGNAVGPRKCCGAKDRLIDQATDAAVDYDGTRY